MLRKFATLALLSAFLALPTGCGAIMSLLPTVIAFVTDAVLILDQIEDFVRRYFAVAPNPEKEKAIAAALGRCRSALIVAQRTAKGTQELDQQKVDAAFADFKVAYQQLAALLDGIPGLRVQRSGEAPLAATPDTFVVPAPEALTPKVSQ